MHYKSAYRRVRPSFILPGLLPAFGPPGHPAFPSGHSFLGHFIALLLLEIPEVRTRFGLNVAAGESYDSDALRRDAYFAALAGTGEIKSPLLWLSGRLARNRELLGVHYPSDSSASRHLARNIWIELFAEKTELACPSLMRIVNRAKAEWTD